MWKGQLGLLRLNAGLFSYDSESRCKKLKMCTLEVRALVDASCTSKHSSRECLLCVSLLGELMK